MNLKKYIGTTKFYKNVLILVVPIIIQNGITAVFGVPDVRVY